MICKVLSILLLLFDNFFNSVCFISKSKVNQRYVIKNWNIERRSNNNNNGYKLNLSIIKDYDDNNNSLNYPVIQVFLNSELKTELFCDSDVELFVKKIKSYLIQLINEIDVSTYRMNNDTSINNVYSDNQLKQEILGNNLIVLKLFKQNCKRCVEFDEYFYNLYSNYDNFSIYRWFQADAANIPNYVSNFKSRLTGDTKMSDEVIEDCMTCNNSGFTICAECDGKGIVNRGANTVYCPQCVGYKKVRCHNCGGKCISCST